MNCRPLANWLIDLVRFGWRQKIIHAQMQNYQSWKFLLKFVCVSMIMFLLEHVLFLKMEFSLCKVWLIRCACGDSQFQRLKRNGDAAAHLRKISSLVNSFLTAYASCLSGLLEERMTLPQLWLWSVSFAILINWIKTNIVTDIQVFTFLNERGQITI